MSRIGSFPLFALLLLGLAACTDGSGTQPSTSSAMASASGGASAQPADEAFWPTEAPPRCYTEGGLPRVVTGEAVAVIDQAGSLTRRQPLAIAYNPATARGDGTGHIAVWSDYDSPGFYRWACKAVTAHVIEMVRNGMGATIKVHPEPDGVVRDFEVAKLHVIHDFDFTIWRDGSVCQGFVESMTAESC